MKLNKRHFGLAPVFIGIWLFYAGMVDDRFYIFEGGSAHYLVMAKFLARAHQYWELNLPKPAPHIKIPPGLSLLLAPIYYFFGWNIVLIKILFLIFIIGASLLSYLLFLKLTQDWKRAILITLFSFLFSPNYFLMRKVASEIPFLFFSYLALIYLMDAEQKKLPLWKSALIGLLLGGTCLLRSAGIALILAFALFVFSRFFFARAREHLVQGLVILFVASSIVLSWQVRCYLEKQKNQYGYLDFIFARAKIGSLEQGLLDLQPPLWEGPEKLGPGEFWRRIKDNAHFYIQSVRRGKRDWGFISILSIILLIGLIVNFRKSWTLNCYGILYLLQILIWPFPDLRLLGPIIGIYFFWLIDTVFRITTLRKTYWQNWLATDRILFSFLYYFYFGIILLGLVALLMLFATEDYRIWKASKMPKYPRTYTLSRHFKLVPLTPARDRFVQMILYLKENAEPDATIASVDLYLVNLITDRKSTIFPATDNYDQFWDYFKTNQIRYLIVDEIYQDLWGGVSLMTPAYLLPALKHCPFSTQVVHQVPFSQTRVLAINYEEK